MSDLPAGDIAEIQRLLSHRYPFLLVDRILEVAPGKSIRALKNITFNEPVFQGHFPGQPIFPGVLILEALAQATGLLACKTPEICPAGDGEPNLFLLVGIDNARFRRTVVPGDSLILEAKLARVRGNFASFEAVASVDGEEAARAEIMCTFKEPEAD